MNVNNLIINHPRRVFRFWRIGWRTERVLRKARRNPLYKLDGLSRKETRQWSPIVSYPFRDEIVFKGMGEVWRRTNPARGATMKTMLKCFVRKKEIKMPDATRYMTSPMAARKYVQETYGTSQGNTWRTQVLSRHFACDIDYYGWHRRMHDVPGFEIIAKTKSMSGWYVTVDVTYRIAC